MYRTAMILCLLAAPASASVITLEDVTVPGSGFHNTSAFSSGGVLFNNTYDATWGSWGGFAASNVVNISTPGWSNQFAAWTGGGDASANYAIGYHEVFTPTVPRIDLASGTRATSVRIANTTYAGLSMLLGDDPPGPGKKFGGTSGNDADWLLLTITGREGATATGTVDFYLADYRFSNNALDYIVNQWTTVNLSTLGNATALEFTLTSSDNGTWGMNTPAYFALDNLNVTPVPEPGSLGLMTLALGVVIRRRFS